MAVEAILLIVALVFVWLGLAGHLYLIWREKKALERSVNEARAFFEQAYSRMDLRPFRNWREAEKTEVWTGE